MRAWPLCYSYPRLADRVWPTSVAPSLHLIYLTSLTAYGLVSLLLLLHLRNALALLPALAFLLALSGALVSIQPITTLMQSIGGIACIAALVPLLTAWRAEPIVLARAGRRTLANLLTLLALQRVTGTSISARAAGAAYAITCEHFLVAGAWKPFDPFEPGAAIDLLRNTVGGQPLQALHRLGGILLALIGIGAAFALVRGRHGQAAVAALVVAALLGMAIAANDGPIIVVIAHAVAGAIAIGLVSLRLCCARASLQGMIEPRLVHVRTQRCVARS